VTSGTGEAVATATGMQTRFGHVGALTQRTRRERSPLELELRHVVYIVAALAVTIGVVFFMLPGCWTQWTSGTGSSSPSA
jgi:magnesium-transporting ATPase (P-type)